MNMWWEGLRWGCSSNEGEGDVVDETKSTSMYGSKLGAGRGSGRTGESEVMKGAAEGGRRWKDKEAADGRRATNTCQPGRGRGEAGPAELGDGRDGMGWDGRWAVGGLGGSWYDVTVPRVPGGG
jgi:hypothetical protein